MRVVKADPKTLHVHTDAKLVPEMRPVEWDAFFDDVRERGIVEPLQLAPDREIVPDGRNRLRAALELKLPSVPVCVVHLNGMSEVEFMLRSALSRRHLSDDQRAILAVRMAEAIGRRQRQESAKRAANTRWNQCAGDTVSSTHRPRARDQAAEAFGVSTRKVRRAQRISKEAPDLSEKVAAGGLPIVLAERELRKREAMALAEAEAKAIQRGERKRGGGTVLPLEVMWTNPQKKLESYLDQVVHRVETDLGKLLKELKSYRSYIIKETCFEILAVPGAREAITRVIYQLEQHEKDINEVKKSTCQSLLELEEEFLDVAEHASEIPIPWGHHNNPEWRDELLAANRRQKNYNGYCGWPGCWNKEPTDDYCNEHKTNDPELLKLPDVKPLFATLNGITKEVPDSLPHRGALD